MIKNLIYIFIALWGCITLNMDWDKKEVGTKQ